jgi:hypothetical protein
MGGLDNIKNTEPDASAESDALDTAQTGALSAAGKTPQSKDKFLQGTPAANNPAAINEDLLNNMRAMIAEREAQKNGFLSTLRDANAWWSGGIAGPGEALSRRALEKENESASIFNMKNQLAQYNALLGANANQAKSLMGTISPTGAPAAGGAPGAPTAGGAPVTPTMPITAQNEIKRLLSLNPPDVVGAQAIRNKWIGNEVKFDPTRFEQKEVVINGKKYDLFPDQIAHWQQTGQLPGQQAPAATPSPSGVNAFNVGNVRPQGASTGFQQPTDMTEGLSIMDKNLKAYGDKGINTLEGIISRWSPPNENNTAALIKAAAQRLSIDPKQPIDLSNPAVRQAVGTAIMLQEKGPKGIFTAPATNASLPQQRAELQVTLPFPNATTKAEIKANEDAIAKAASIKTEAAGKEALTVAEESGKESTQLQKDSERANKTIAAAERVIKLADDPKLNKVMGWMHGGDKAATYLGAIPKFAADVVGKGDKFEEAAKEVTWAGDKDLVAANQQLKTDATQLGIEYTASMFKGARLGIGLEKLGLQGKGVSPDYLPKINKLYATLAKDAAEFDLKKNQAFKDWKGGNPSKTYNDFLSTPGYEKMLEDERELLLSRHPGISVDILGAPKGSSEHKTTKSGVKYKVL